MPNKNLLITNLTAISFKNSEFAEFPEFKQIANKTMFKSDYNFTNRIIRRENTDTNTNKCQSLLKSLRTNTRNIKNFDSFWSKLSERVVGIVDYVDPIQAAMRTWDLKFAVMPCQLRWSNNLMMVLNENGEQDDGKCLKFTAATEGELFVVIATTPSDQNTWYIFQITTKGVIFYKEGNAMLLNEDSAAGTTGNRNIYQNFFICLNFEKRSKMSGLFIQYGIQVNSDESSHLYLNYFDERPLTPSYYSFGSRNADVEIFNAHLEPFLVDEQIELRCKQSSNMNKALPTLCDYKCNEACDGCTAPYSAQACKRCAYAALMYNTTKTNASLLVCAQKCPNGFEPNLKLDNLCIGIEINLVF
jgi:hypothetical protein